jgi:molecular chaperone DnaJ
VTVRREWLEKDYYEVLGVDRAAGERDIKKAYRRLAQQYHPDNNPDDASSESRFRDITEAYDVLSDPKARAEYDQARDAFARGAWAGGPGGSTQYVRVDDIGDLGDLGDLFGGVGGFGGLGDIFGRGRSTRGPQRGGDIEGEVSLTFHEAVSGATRSLEISGPDGPRTVQVKIPPGVDDGERIRVRGKGQPGSNGGPRGDLLVRVRAGTHPVFRRSGKNLEIEVPITFAEATLGANITVPTLHGTVTLKVPPGTPSGKTFRVRNKGVTTPKATGDLLVTVTVAVPDTLSDEQREAVLRLAGLDDSDPRKHLGV